MLPPKPLLSQNNVRVCIASCKKIRLLVQIREFTRFRFFYRELGLQRSERACRSHKDNRMCALHL